jgi:hypothetical protein
MRDPDADDDAPEADDHLGRRVRFIDASDDDITDKVWRLYERASRERAAGLPIPPSTPPTKDQPMSDLPQHLEDTMRAYKLLEHANGTSPMAKEVVAHLDDGSSLIAVANRLVKLRKLGLISRGTPGARGAGGRKKADVPKAPRSSKPSTTAKAAPAKAAAPTSDGTLLMRLEAERDKHRAIADKLDDTIEALQAFA